MPNMNYYYGQDVEFGFESTTHKYFMIGLARTKRVLKNKYVKVYIQLTFVLLLTFLSKYFIPSNIIHSNERLINVLGDVYFDDLKWNSGIIPPTNSVDVKDFEILQNKEFFDKQKQQIANLYEDMSNLIVSHKLACLSGMYIGLNRNIIMIVENTTNMLIMNPVITSSDSENITVEEECIVSGITSFKNRSKYVTVDYMDANDFKYYTNVFNGFSSICLQHHIDLLS